MSPPVAVLLVVAAAAALAAASYLWGGPVERPSWLAIGGRAVAWSALGLLLLNVACPATSLGDPPLVLLDRSPSLDARGGQASAAAQAAEDRGEVAPFDGSRLLAPLTAAAATGRPVVVVTDGEIGDVAAIPVSLLATASVVLLPRETAADRIVAGIEGPRHVAQGDSLMLVADLRMFGGADTAGLSLEVRAGATVLARAPVGGLAGGRARVPIQVAPIALPAGDHLLDVVLLGEGESDPRTDHRTHLISVAATPGIILVANSGTWDSRFLYRTLVDVAGLPVQGFLQLEPGSWRRMSDARAVSTAVVREAVRNADLLVTFGEGMDEAAGGRTRGRWRWPVEATTEGDWYLSAVAEGPLSGSFGGISSDSLLPATGLVPLTPAAGGWVGMTAQLGRRGAGRPVVVGVESRNGREVSVGATGLWRWAFQGGMAEQAYRAWAAGVVTWLLGRPGGPDDVQARLVRPVVERDQPLVFEWQGTGAAQAVPVRLEQDAVVREDTLHFDGAGRASLRPGVGSWRYTLPGGGSGLAAVEEYSAEFLPAPVTMEVQEASILPPARHRGSRESAWLFGLAILGWCVEWTVRRRAGLR